MKEADPEALDVITSKSSTLPYDDDKMQKMIELVQRAKRTSRSGYDTGLTGCVTQRYKRAWMMWVAWNITMRRQVSVPHTLVSFNTLMVLRSARLLSFFGKPAWDLSHRLTLTHFQHTGGSYTSTDRGMHGYCLTRRCTPHQSVKDPLLSRFCRCCSSLPQKFISWRWKSCGQMKSLSRGLGRVS